MSAAAVEPPSFRIQLGPSKNVILAAGLPVLSGEAAESIFPPARLVRRTGTLALFESGPWRLGVAELPAPSTYADVTARLYREVFEALGEHRLCRIWNYVPGINAEGADGLENYRSFSCGRSLAFEQRFGRDFKAHLPAGSAVGSDGDRLVVIFAASSLAPRHCENPVQVPAYEYPAKHGPRPPSFSRATAVADGKRLHVFVSGTAAIKGHETVGLGDTPRQLAQTLENLRGIFAVAGLEADLRAGRADSRHFKVYLRSAGDLPVVTKTLSRELFRPGDRVSYLRTDLCRAELDVEIEATVLGSEL
jgi:enamine deaminase RidA (YjgF/YER057c/UK114 family)